MEDSPIANRGWVALSTRTTDRPWDARIHASRLPENPEPTIAKSNLLRLTLGELCTTASTAEAVLLAFLHTGIAGKESIVAERLEIFFCEADESAGESHADRASLAHRATAGDASDYIDFVRMADVVESLRDEASFAVASEILFEGSIVDGNFSGSWANANASDAGLSATGSEAISGDLVFLDEHALLSLGLYQVMKYRVMYVLFVVTQPSPWSHSRREVVVWE